MSPTVRPGTDSNGRACFRIFDSGGKATGQYAYTEEKARSIAAKTAPAVRLAPVARSAAEARPVAAAAKPASRPKNPCPICNREMVIGTTAKVENGRWVHTGCRQQEEVRVTQEAEAARGAALKGAWWLADRLKPEHLDSAWPAGPITQIAGTGYSERDVARLLGRSDREAYPVVLRLLNRMWERQTEDERAVGDARHRNFQGFSKPDAGRAQFLLGQSALGYTPELHYRISQLLSRYAGTQLLQIMNEGAQQKGRILRLNPWRR